MCVRSPRLLVLLLVLLLFACGGPEPDSLEEIPLSPDLASIEQGAVILTGRVFDVHTGAPIANAIVSTFPDTEILRTTSTGQFVIQRDLVTGQTYQVTAEADGYADGRADVLASSERESVQIPLVSSDRHLPITFVPDAAVLTPTENLTEIAMVSGEVDDLEWSLQDAPDWVTLTPEEDTLRPNRTGQLTVELNAEVFGAIAASRSSHHGYVELHDDRDRVAVLNVIAVPAPSGEVLFQVFMDEEEELMIGDSLTADARVRLGDTGIFGASIVVDISGPDGGLTTTTPVRTDDDGDATFTFEALLPGDYELLFRLPAYPDVNAVSHSLTVGGGVHPCDVDNGGCGDYAECSLDVDGDVSCVDLDLCTPDEAGENYCGTAQYWTCEERPLQAPICTDIDECATGDHSCDLDVEICVNQIGAAATCEPIPLPEIINLEGPPAVSNDPSSTLTFECSLPDCTFECSLAVNGTPFFTNPDCESPFTYPTTDGDYTFTVTATDGENSSEPATWEWTVDTEIPVIEDLTGPSSPTTSTQAQFSYSCSKEDCAFSCEVSEATQGLLFGPISCIDTFGYPTVNDGTYTFTVIATDLAENVSQPATWTWTVDREPPVVTNLEGPEGVISDTDALYEFGCSKAGCTLLCSLSAQGQGSLFIDEDCSTGSQLYTDLTDDIYTFSVRAIDSLGTEGPAEESSFTVNTPPSIENLSGPGDPTNDTDPAFSFDCSKVSCTFECFLEGPETIGPEPCDSGSVTYTDLPDGAYTFTVRAWDALDVAGPSETFDFTIDTVLPEIAFLESPEEVIIEDWAPFDFECTNKDSCTFECRLDEAFDPGTFYDCAPPLVEADLKQGEYTFTVRATDAAGNETSVSHFFAVVPLGWEQVSVGSAHTCAVGTDRSLWCWGNGGNYRLGLGTTLSHRVPRSVSDDRDWIQVSAGDAHSCAIRVDGTLWCWGLGDHGRLGNDSTATEILPAQVGSETDWIQVVAAGSHTCGLRAEDDTLYCWGDNAAGRLGNDDDVAANPYHTPQEISSGWAYLSASMNHTCGLTLEGALYCWGVGATNRLGLGDINNRLVPTEVEIIDLHPDLDPDLPWLDVSAGFSHTCAVRADNSLWCWGNGANGRLGSFSTTNQARPFMIGIELEWESVRAGDAHTCAQRLDGTLWCWGYNRTGQLGFESPNELTPQQVNTRTDWASLSLGSTHTCAIDEENVLSCWGNNLDGRLGLNLNEGSRFFPSAMVFDKEVVFAAAGQETGCLITTDGELYCSGDNRTGALGVGDFNDRARPTRVGTFSDWIHVAKGIGPGASQTCAIRTDGRLYCWGLNTYGVLGVGGGGNRNVPVQVDVGTTWSHVDTGWYHSCGIQTDESLWCWGHNLQGQLGLGGGSQWYFTPQEVGDESWLDTTTGRSHSCGIQTDGSLWCWGFGSLGLGVGGTFTTPQQVGEDTDWVEVVAGHNHTCALKTDRSLWCWGDGGYGKLGHSEGGSVPNQVGTDLDWEMISLGEDHTCGLKTDGRAFCWGRGTYGRLGLGIGDNMNTPQQLVHSDWTFISAGGHHTYGARSSHTGAFGWGWNLTNSSGSGQLGNDTSFKRVPTELESPSPP